LLDTSRNKLGGLKETEFESNEWPGALYYQIHPFRADKKNYYLVFGYDGATANTNRKLMDVVWFDPDRGPVFGAPVFKKNIADYDPAHRWVVDCADQAVITFRYEAAADIVILSELSKPFEHSPEETSLLVPTGDYHYFRQDKKGRWVFYAVLNDFDFSKKRRKR